jgi:hypothetical protein
MVMTFFFKPVILKIYKLVLNSLTSTPQGIRQPELQELPVPSFERARGGGIPTGVVLEVVAWQPDLLSRAAKGAQEGNKPGIGRV